MSKFTNISLKPVGEIEGYPIQPCLKSGFCCTLVPCMYGESISATERACKHLQPPNEIGQRDCGRYEWIKANVVGYEYYPAFGSGCGSMIGNEPRQKLVQIIKKMNDENI